LISDILIKWYHHQRHHSFIHSFIIAVVVVALKAKVDNINPNPNPTRNLQELVNMRVRTLEFHEWSDVRNWIWMYIVFLLLKNSDCAVRPV